MKLNKDFTLMEVMGENILVANGPYNIKSGKICSLNKSAALLWKTFTDVRFNPEDMANALVSEYGIEHNTALRDTQELCSHLLHEGLAEL